VLRARERETRRHRQALPWEPSQYDACLCACVCACMHVLRGCVGDQLTRAFICSISRFLPRSSTTASPSDSSTCTNAYIHTYVCTYRVAHRTVAYNPHTYSSRITYILTCMHTSIDACSYRHVATRISDIHIRSHVHTHTHTHIHMHIRNLRTYVIHTYIHAYKVQRRAIVHS